MVVRQRVYDIVRGTFTGQVLEYEQLPKNIGASIKVNFRYVEGKRISDIVISVEDKPVKFGEVQYLGKGETGDYFNVSIPFYKVYKLNDEGLFNDLSRLIPQERDRQDVKKVKARRPNLKEVTDIIVSIIEASKEDVNKTMDRLEAERAGDGIKEESRKSVGSPYEPEVEGTVKGEYFKIKGFRKGDLGGKGTLILGNDVAYYDFTSSEYKEESEIPIEKWDKIDSLNKKYGTLFSAKEGVEKYGYKG